MAALGRVVVTGGAGVVGSTIVDHLVRAGSDDIVVFDAFSRGQPKNLDWARAHGRVRVVNGDIRDRSAVRAAFDGAEIVFHQAAIRVTQCAEDPRLAFEVMIEGTFNVAEAAVAAGVRKVVYASSAAVYGAASRMPIPESHALDDNRTLYGVAKAFGETLFRSARDMHGLDFVALRYFNVYGPRMALTGPHTEVMVRWMERIAAGEAPLILGDGSQTNDFVHVDDVARANLLAATTPVTDEVFNVATGVETSLRRLAELLLRAMGSDLEPQFGPARSVNNVARRVGDVTKARELLGFEARTALEPGLGELVRWWMDATRAGQGAA